MTSIRAVLFDADGVIQHPTGDIVERLEAVLGFLPDPLDDFIRDVMTAEIPALTGEQDFLSAVAPVLARWSCDATVPFIACWSAIAVDTDILELIGRLRRSGYLCVLATNQQCYRAKHMAETLGYDDVFDHSFYSHDLGFAKPDERYFESIVDALPHAASEMLFIDDRAQNVEAARATGLSAARFVNPRRPGAASDLLALLEEFSVRPSR